MIIAKDLIHQALMRANLETQLKPADGSLYEDGYRLLKGITSKYNNDDLLSFTEETVILPNAEIIHIYDDYDSLIGEHRHIFNTVIEMNIWLDDEATELNINDIIFVVANKKLYIVNEDLTVNEEIQEIPPSQDYQELLAYTNMKHIKVKDCCKINALYLETKTPNSLHRPLEFEPKNKFDEYGISTCVYTVAQKAENEWLIQLKPGIARMNYFLKLVYNRGFEYDMNDPLYIPDAYIELLITALTHKLALKYPRMNDAQMQRLENDVKVMIDNIRTPKADIKPVKRNSYRRGFMTGDMLVAGVGIFN